MKIYFVSQKSSLFVKFILVGGQYSTHSFFAFHSILKREINPDE